MKLKKDNIFYKYRTNKEYQRYYHEAKDLLDIAIQIAEARKKKKLTQSQLAKRVGMPQSQIARLESGSVNTTFSTIQKVASVLNKRLILSNG